MQLIKFDTEYVNIRHIIYIAEPEQMGDKWEISLKTDASQYACLTWSFSSQFEAEQEFRKLVDKFKI